MTTVESSTKPGMCILTLFPKERSFDSLNALDGTSCFSIKKLTQSTDISPAPADFVFLQRQ